MSIHPRKALLCIVLTIVALRILVIGLSPLDLFVDETQYWLWGQELAFGYYSKPPMIGWVLAGFDLFNFNGHPIWLRMPAPIFHGITAILLAGLTNELLPDQRWAQVHAAALYLSMPIIAVGSFLISTDTIMAPFFVAGLWAYVRAVRLQTLQPAILAGVLFGFALLSKYAAMYALIGCIGIQLTTPSARLKWSTFGIFLIVVMVTFSPNVVWNALNGLTTASHTVDNASWIREGVNIDLASALGFVASQVLALGPGLFTLAVVILLKSQKPEKWLLWLVIPAFVIVTLQAMLASANANWAFASILGLAIVVPYWNETRLLKKRWQWIIYLPNALLSIGFALLLLVPTLFPLGNGQPVGGRYIGQSVTSNEIISQAQSADIKNVFAENRSILADLYYTGRKSDLTFLSLKRFDGDRHYYDQLHSDTAHIALDEKVIYVGPHNPTTCENNAIEVVELPIVPAYHSLELMLFKMPFSCLQTTIAD